MCAIFNTVLILPFVNGLYATVNIWHHRIFHISLRMLFTFYTNTLSHSTWCQNSNFLINFWDPCTTARISGSNQQGRLFFENAFQSKKSKSKSLDNKVWLYCAINPSSQDSQWSISNEGVEQVLVLEEGLQVRVHPL